MILRSRTGLAEAEEGDVVAVEDEAMLAAGDLGDVFCFLGGAIESKASSISSLFALIGSP